MPRDPNVEALVDAALAQLREQMLQELADGTATHGTLDQIEDAVARLGDEFRRLQEQIIAECTRTPRENALPCPWGGRARYHLTRERVLMNRHGELRPALLPLRHLSPRLRPPRYRPGAGCRDDDHPRG
jgi:hypothetical protein